jgi:two-component system, cell cycle sensor histidine kinase and response regulator CckA
MLPIEAKAGFLSPAANFLTLNPAEDYWMADRTKHEILYVNPAYETIWDSTCESLYASPKVWFEAIHPDDRERMFQAALTGHSHRTYYDEYRIVCADGTVRWVRDRAFRMRDVGGRAIRIAGVAEDVTERHQLEMQLRQAQKMEAIGKLAAGVAHDFNNLLSVILGHSEMLAMRLPAHSPERDSVDEIGRAAERAATLTRRLLAFSCHRVVEPQVLDLNLLVADMEKMLRRLIGENVRLITILQPGLNRVLADPGQIDQIIMNLAVNGRDAMPNGGRLTLQTRDLELDAKTQSGLRPRRYVLLAVTDTGCGMTPEVQARIFEPFFTTKGVGQGTGLGLEMVSGIVQQNGGHIVVHSLPGIGTTFKIYLPAVGELAKQPLQSRTPVKSVRSSETILLVEDEAAVREVTALLLVSLGYRVKKASSGQEALHLAQGNRDKIDLLMTDVRMPGMSGNELAEVLRASDARLKVLFLSGHSGDTLACHGIVHTEVAFLQKPFTLNALSEKLMEVLDRT